MRRTTAGLLALGVLLARAAAHPNHQAIQRMDVAVVPATEPAPTGARVSITIAGDRRIITANGLPDHATGAFPNANNPNRIAAQNYRFTVPLRPVVQRQPTPLVAQPFGIALNGVLFDPGTAEYWHNDRQSGWHYDAKGDAFSLGLDASNAHVQPNGAYHYHGIPAALLARLSAGQPALTLLGWAADGFPIYGPHGHEDARSSGSRQRVLKSSYQLKKGPRPNGPGQPGGSHDGIFEEDFEFVAGSGDLDECSGRFGVTPEFPEGTYHYVLTPDFPFVPRAFRGTPDASFARRGGPGAPKGRQKRGPPP
ncbi:MAG TPA: YHYH protein [Opitutaceae bacterium]|nr:YHYH protein [Opitutaceae bacterium]